MTIATIRTAVARLLKLYGINKKIISNPGINNDGAVVSLGVIDSKGNLIMTGDNGLGYVSGVGGAVTQGTNSGTAVTLDKLTGQVTTVALTTAAAGEEVFTLTNAKIAAADIVVVGTTYSGAGTPVVSTKKTVAGATDLVITNLHASAALNAAVVINFAVIKGSAS